MAGKNERLMKLSETSFPITIDKPVNLRILLHAASSQMSSSRLRKVMFIKRKISAGRTIFVINCLFYRVNQGVTHHPPTPCCLMMIRESCPRWRPVQRVFEGVANREVHFLWSGRPVKRWNGL